MEMKILLKSILNKIKVFFKQVFSISVFDNHKVIYILGFHIRSKIKCKPVENLITEFGLNTEARDEKIVLSLTTFPDRINTVQETIKTLLKQTYKPDAVILWLAEEQFPTKEAELPEDLLKLRDFGLTIKWCNDIKSYKKLIPALKEYPNDIIITFDDDIYYDDDIVENLYKAYKQHGCICTNRAGRLKFTKSSIKALPTAQVYWTKYDDNSSRNTIIGCGGVLYPPNSLAKEVLDEEKFMSVMPTQDDVWFWAMAVLAGTPIRVVSAYDLNIRTVENTQQYGLCKINKKKGKKGMHAKDGYALMANVYPDLLDKAKSIK